ncbi:MAG: FAD-binding protein [Armatimonadetes bacterium]|nr:FAD-binding protein [Armatimonadota bacterium]
MQSRPPRPPRAAIEQCIRELQSALGDDAVLTKPADLLAYDGDAYPIARQRPEAVVLPSSTEDTANAVRICSRYGVPFVPRGAGTGLSGGATPVEGGIVISTARMSGIIETDIQNRRAVVEAGCLNQAITDAVAAHGLHYAPDPSSQGVCTIGGNIAENAGGPHTLKYGVTVNHVTGVKLVLPDGRVVQLGGKAEEPAGYDLVGLVVGSEGTFGIVTEATVKLTPNPAAVRTLLAVFDRVEDCTQCVVQIIGAGLIPCAMEMIDRTILGAIEDAFHFGFPREAAAVLTIELDGDEQGLDEEAEIARAVCLRWEAREVRVASTPEDRARLWIARKKGVGTAGRLASSIVTQDGAIPRSKLPEVLARVGEIAQSHGIRVCNIFHAGDGNLHPCVLYNQSDADEARRVHAFNEDVLRLCVEVGGTITGEHGVGIEKRSAMRLMFSDADLGWMERIRAAFDPAGLCNPGKLLPEARSEGRGERGEKGAIGSDGSDGWDRMIRTVHAEATCLEIRGAHAITGSVPIAVLRPDDEQTCCDTVRWAARERVPLVPWGGGSCIEIGGPVGSPLWAALSTSRLRSVGPVSPDDTLITCAAGVPFAEVQAALAPYGQWVPLDPPVSDVATVGGVVALNATGLLRCSQGSPGDSVVALRTVNSSGDIVRTGARVVKNAAGYDIGRLLAGSMGTLGLITEVTFRTRPLPASFAAATFGGSDPAAICRAAWSVHVERLTATYLAVLHGETPSLLVGLAGTGDAVDRQREAVTAEARRSGLAPMDANGLHDEARRVLWAVGKSCAARISSAPYDAARLAERLAHARVQFCWLVQPGIIVAWTEDDARAFMQTVWALTDGTDGTVRWLKTPPGVPSLTDRTDRTAGSVALSRALKSALDPDGVFSPGRLGQRHGRL